MNELFTRRSRLLALLTIVALLIIFFVLHLLTHGFIYIENKLDSDITIGLDDKKGGWATIKPGATKKIYIKTGDHTIVSTQSSSNALSVYYVAVQGLRSKHVSPSFKNQKSTEYLGESTLGCASHDSLSGQITYYACADSYADRSSYSLTNDGKTYNNIQRPASGSINETPYLNTLYLSPSTFLDVIRNNERTDGYATTVNKLSFAQNGITTKSKAIESSSSQISTDTKTLNNPAFVLFSNEQRKLRYFSSFTDNNPKEFSLGDAAGGAADTNKIIDVAKNNLLFFSGQQSRLADDSEKGANKKQIQQKLTAFDVTSGKKTSASVSSDLLVSGVSVNDSGVGLLVAHNKKDNVQQLYLYQGGELTLQPVRNAESACWINDRIVFLDSSFGVFSYEPSESVSTLIYSNDAFDLANFNCSFGSIYFTIKNHGDTSVDTGLRHMELKTGGRDNTGTRVENILPILGDEEYSIRTADYFLDQAVVLYGNISASCSKNVDQEKKILQHLQDKGLDSAEITVTFKASCEPASR